jgi:hypothetical protein
MPAKSKSQQRLFGIVHAIQKGEVSPRKFSKKIRDMAKRVDPGDARDFASTKTNGLPEKKKESEKREKSEKAASFLDRAFALGFVSGIRPSSCHSGHAIRFGLGSEAFWRSP